MSADQLKLRLISSAWSWCCWRLTFPNFQHNRFMWTSGQFFFDQEFLEWLFSFLSACGCVKRFKFSRHSYSSLFFIVIIDLLLLHYWSTQQHKEIGLLWSYYYIFHTTLLFCWTLKSASNKNKNAINIFQCTFSC